MQFNVTGGLTISVVTPGLTVALDGIAAQLAAISKLQEQIMSQITDWAAKEATALASIQAGIAKLDAAIQAFQNSPGTLSAADQAALDNISSISDALAAAANAIPQPPAGA